MHPEPKPEWVPLSIPKDHTKKGLNEKTLALKISKICAKRAATEKAAERAAEKETGTEKDKDAEIDSRRHAGRSTVV